MNIYVNIISLLSSFLTIKNSKNKVTKYTTIVKALIYDFVFIGHPPSNGEISSYVLNGLRGEFKHHVGVL